MEPNQTEITIYVINSTVDVVEERFHNVHIDGFGKDATYRRESTGWWVSFEGSGESLFFGDTKPELDVGDKVKITFERIINAKS